MHSMALLFARRAGVEPDPERWPELRRALLAGPRSAVSFRLEARTACLRPRCAPLRSGGVRLSRFQLISRRGRVAGKGPAGAW